MLKPFLMGVVALSLFTVTACGDSKPKTTTYSAELSGKNQVPPVTSDATGTAKLTLDRGSKTLTWEVTYKGLTGEPTAAHLHGPAKEGANAAPIVPFNPPLASPLRGSSVVSDTVITQLDNGEIYLNIHTAANPNGEIRGQLKK